MSERRRPWWKGSRGEWWFVGQVVLVALLAFAPARWRWTAGAGEAWRVAGAVLIAAGVAQAALGIFWIGSGVSPFPRPPEGAVLVQSGIYALVRHPMYGGLIIAALGWTFWHTSVLHVLLTVALAVFMYAKAGHEEVLLQERFPEYASYRTRTKRLIPGLF